MRVPMRGPGRPRKWNKPLKQWRADIPEDDYDFIEETRARLGLSRAEFIHMVLRQANINLLEFQAKIKHLEEALAQERKEKYALREQLEKERQEKEKWRLKYEAAVKGISISSISKEAEKFRLIAEKVQEGKSWKQVCIEVGIRNEAKMRELLKIAFNIYDEYGKIAETFTPKDSVPEFKAWTLLKDGKGMLDYVFVPRGQEKAFKKLKEAEQEIKEKKVTKIHDPAAEVTSTLKEWYRTYFDYLKSGKEKQAMDFLLGVQVNGLKRLLEKYGEETVKDVVYSDPRFVDVFSSLLESLLREMKKKKEEVVAE